MNIREELFSYQDLKYRDFTAKLTPTVEKQNIIGVRVPVIRQMAKKYGKSDKSGALPHETEVFLQDLPHKYYEENNLHGLIIERINDFKECVERLDAFLPYVDNWATCDIIRPKVFARNKEELKNHVKRWMASDKTYTLRFGIEMAMSFYLDREFDIELANLISDIESGEYYVNMMIAWYFATALAKQYEAIIPFIENRKLSEWIHNKTIQKSVESYRITDEQKKYLRTLKV